MGPGPAGTYQTIRTVGHKVWVLRGECEACADAAQDIHVGSGRGPYAQATRGAQSTTTTKNRCLHDLAEGRKENAVHRWALTKQLPQPRGAVHNDTHASLLQSLSARGSATSQEGGGGRRWKPHDVMDPGSHIHRHRHRHRHRQTHTRTHTLTHTRAHTHTHPYP